MTDYSSLNRLGWQPFFQQQLTLDEWQTVQPARVVEQHRSEIELATGAASILLQLNHNMPPLTVGDWILLDEQARFLRALERQSCFRRMAAGSGVAEQLIAANVDTAFIVCSLNDDFNLNRIERYLIIANEAGAEPVVVLSKFDTCAHPVQLRDQVQALDTLLCVEMVNCLDRQSSASLQPWCKPGKTVVLMGSSGAGKSTLSNTLMEQQSQATRSIREDDSKGRHTTTRRSLLAMPNGALILDTPGMRELQLGASESGMAATFSDIEELARRCRFKDCGHRGEPGCAVVAAIEAGVLDQRRLINYQKLGREQAKNAASLAQRRAAEKDLAKYYKRTQAESRKFKK